MASFLPVPSLRIAYALALALFTASCQAATEPDTVAKAVAPHSECGENRFAHPALKTGQHRGAARVHPPRPAKGDSYRDADYGVCITRLTDHRKEPPEGFARVLYSRFQAFNADESRILVLDHAGYWHLYDAESLAHIKQLNLGGASVEPHWHPSDPHLLHLLPNNGGLALHTFHVEREQRRTIVDFTALRSIAGYPDTHDIRKIWPKAARVWTRWEGSPSLDARYWAFQVETADEEPLALISFDLTTQSIIASYDIQDVGRPDHVSMSPKGNYVVASWPEKAADCPLFRKRGTLKKPCGLMAFTRDFRKATALAGNSPHSDIAIDAKGREVIVISNYASGDVEMVDLASGDVTRLWRMYIDGASTALHVSGKAYRKRGWVLISTYWAKDPENAKPWYENRLMAVELKEDPRIITIANIVSKTRTYFSEPHATVNRDFTRVVFNANWGTGKDEDIDTYIAWLAPGAIPGT